MPTTKENIQQARANRRWARVELGAPIITIPINPNRAVQFLPEVKEFARHTSGHTAYNKHDTPHRDILRHDHRSSSDVRMQARVLAWLVPTLIGANGAPIEPAIHEMSA
jgi:hypothetical protein